MAIAGHGLPSSKIRLEHGQPRIQGSTQARPIYACYSSKEGSLGTLAEACAALFAGETITLDMRDDNFITLRNLCDARAAACGGGAEPL